MNDESEHDTDAASLAKIKAAREEVRERKTEYFDIHERDKEAKKAVEAAEVHLEATIDAVNRPLPLFDGAAVPEVEMPSTAEDAQFVAEAIVGITYPPDDDVELPVSWEELGVDELGLSPSKCAKLTTDGIATLGDLNRYVQSHGANWIGDWYYNLNRFGKTAAVDVAARWENFQAKHPEWFGEKTP